MTESIVVNFEPIESNEFEPEDELSSPTRLLEYDSGPYSSGQAIDIYVWGSPLNNLYLSESSNSLGSGEGITLSSDQAVYSENLDFNGSAIEQTTYPISSVNNLIAQTQISKVSSSGILERIASAGASLSRSFGRVGGSAIGINDSSAKIYGTVRATYNRVKYGKKWRFVFPSGGEFWFFIKQNRSVVFQFKVSISSSAGEVASGSAIQDITLIYTNYITEAPVVGASVTLDYLSSTTYSGITDIAGKVTFTNVSSGVHYVHASAPGYLDTDADGIENGEINV